MEQKQFALAINQICEEKGIPKDKAMEIVEAAIAAAYKKDYGEKGQVIEAHFDEETGDVKAYQVKIVAEETTEEEGQRKKKRRMLKVMNPNRGKSLIRKRILQLMKLRNIIKKLRLAMKSGLSFLLIMILAESLRKPPNKS